MFQIVRDDVLLRVLIQSAIFNSTPRRQCSCPDLIASSPTELPITPAWAKLLHPSCKPQRKFITTISWLERHSSLQWTRCRRRTSKLVSTTFVSRRSLLTVRDARSRSTLGESPSAEDPNNDCEDTDDKVDFIVYR
jgi:hypothetical protein